MFQSRRGHAPQISISDDNHHVTEAIGDMYGGDDEYHPRRHSRPLSFISSPLGDALDTPPSPFDPFPTAPPRSPLRAQMSHTNDKPATPTSPNGSDKPPDRRPSFAGRGSGSGSAGSNGPLSPPLSRTNSDTATQQFPLHDLEYESSAAGLAQELSNLQAIRRMSMDVNTADPDLPSFKSFQPSAAPQHFSEEEDPAKLFWVPARLHPELSPQEFKSFIEEKVEKVRRRSSDSDSLSIDGSLDRQGSAGGLRRKKSMLSRQVDNGNGYRDGAERLERKRSGGQPPNGGLPQLKEIVDDPMSLVRRMSIDSAGMHSASDGEAANEDVPILPAGIAGNNLKRSTRTNYRRGSIRKGERVPFSRRVMTRQAETDTEESPVSSPTHSRDPDFLNQGLSRVQSEPANRPDGPENFSRPTRKRSPPLIQQQRPTSDEDYGIPDSAGQPEDRRTSQPKSFHSRIASNGRTTATLPGVPGHMPQQVPQIIETPPQDSQRKPQMPLPERNSSRVPPPSHQKSQPQPQPHPQPPRIPAQSQQRPPSAGRQNRHAQAAQNSPIQPAQSFDDLIAHPSPLPGNNTRIDSLSIIPNLTEEKKSDKKKDKKDEGSRKTSWGWLLGSDDKEKERDKKEKEDREKEVAKKVKNKLSKVQDKSHDDTRLDVLQTSITGGRGRESVVLDRDSVKLEEERKKESNRKSSAGDSKKEKESGLFSSIFGGGKKKGDKDLNHKKATSMRGLSPEPPPRILKPDVDYNWTRFSILEERAIYRMAHIKLANPRRELYSQVLLSNFMYSYLAKVQQMHPQIQIGTSAQAKQQQKMAAAAQQKKDQPEEFTQYQRYQQQQETEKTPNTQQDNAAAEPQHDDDHRADSRTGQNTQHREHKSREQRDQRDHREQREAREQQPRDSHHSTYSQGGANGYSVADSQRYMGQGKQQGYHGYDDSDQSSRDDEMW
ncbi:hypothetical protein BDV95DRAFT_629431 [Massariosphaeria phaeospora]|uniref:Protein Zds1 C-terminal domain-containing protein n=1 Tax=Massariosphaeria phaeospora TaxID=100035 RepID=A0A7C8M8B7_9PLEO|nr:hypothetical protein BDV95DRAFT_629431 [Massariosphaeria phaeospora]